MKHNPITETLSRHVEALIRGEDIAANLLAERPLQDQELEPLMNLAAAIKQALVPVPVPAFRADLHRALAYQAPAQIAIGRPPARYKNVVMAAAATGSLLSIAGLSLILVRRRRSATRPVTSVV
jgi:hypothetical protein